MMSTKPNGAPCTPASMRLPVLAAAALSAVALLGLERSAAAQDASVCRTVRDHARDTVIVLQPPSTFTICRGGEVEQDVVTGRPVYFELAATPGSAMFNFRVHGQSSEWTPTGLTAWQELVAGLAVNLETLGMSGESIAEVSLPGAEGPAVASPIRQVAAARARYVGAVTPRYLEGLRVLRPAVRELPVIADVMRHWCSELAGRPGSATAELQERCGGAELRAGAVGKEVDAMEAAAATFELRRSRARDSILTATTRPDDAAAAAEAVRALDEARGAADSTVSEARQLLVSAQELARDLLAVRAEIRSLDAVRPAVGTYLTTFAGSGNAELEIDAEPIDIAAAGSASALRSSGKTTARFPVVAPHYLDLELGVGATAGLPPIPTLATQASAAVIQGKPVDEFVGLALVEFEPARVLWPDRPLAGLLRLPVIGIPFTRDPTQNFFVGAGLGWTGIGSIAAGPYLLRELSMRGGYPLDRPLPAGTSLDAVTEPALQVGYFISASVDVVGLFHLFFPVHAAALDAATGKEK